MAYTVKQLSTLAGVSVRTLHFYDEAGLLKPASVRRNGYREYGERELLRLQQILFFRELDFPLKEIRRMLDAPGFDEVEALKAHRGMIRQKSNRLRGLLKTIDKTIKRLTKDAYMTDDELYAAFSKEEAEEYKKEARERWGGTEAYRQSQERAKKLTKEDWARIQAEGDKVLRDLVASIDKGPKSPEAQSLIAKHYEGLRAFYEPSPEMYRGLGRMYVDDKRFTAFFDKYDPRLAPFMRDAMAEYADGMEK